MKPVTFDWQALQRRCRGDVIDHGRVEFLPAWRHRIRVEYDFDRDTTGEQDRVFLKVNRIAGSGL